MNHLQVIGSHNSYKLEIQNELFNILLEERPELIGLDYEHLPLHEQLDLGLRKLELDIFHDPKGGRYSSPAGNDLLRQLGVEPLDYDPEGKMIQPGFKTLHVQDIDFRSSCLLLSECLTELKSWSEVNPDHIPIVVTMNVKTDPVDDTSSVVPLPFTSSAYDSLDQLITEVIGKDNLITPLQIKGKYASLNEAILSRGWPKLDDVKGKFLFVLDEPMEKCNTYIDNGDREDRIFFINAPAGHPFSAFLIMNDPVKDEKLIEQRVREGYIVRTRADADTKEARVNDYSRFEAAKRSGAHYISTDYYYETRTNATFKIEFENNSFQRKNPVLVK